jgi:dUTP pyrophosphatase
MDAASAPYSPAARHVATLRERLAELLAGISAEGREGLPVTDAGTFLPAATPTAMLDYAAREAARGFKVGFVRALAAAVAEMDEGGRRLTRLSGRALVAAALRAAAARAAWSATCLEPSAWAEAEAEAAPARPGLGEVLLALVGSSADASAALRQAGAVPLGATPATAAASAPTAPATAADEAPPAPAAAAEAPPAAAEEAPPAAAQAEAPPAAAEPLGALEPDAFHALGGEGPIVVGAPPRALEPDTFHVFGGEGLYAGTPPGAEPTESGLDLRFAADVEFDPKRFCQVVSLGVHVILTDGAGRPLPFLVLPRSSISKTPLMLANSPGLVDATYRGPLRVAVRHLGRPEDQPYAAKAGEALFQAVAADLLPRRVAVRPLRELADMELDGRLPPSARGAGGFGSTGAAGAGAAGAGAAGAGAAGAAAAGQ